MVKPNFKRNPEEINQMFMKVYQKEEGQKVDQVQVGKTKSIKYAINGAGRGGC